MNALIIDTETDQGSNPLPIQVATIDLATSSEWMAYFNTGRPISPKTTKIHSIKDEDVAGFKAFDLTNFNVPDYLIGHHVNFDWRVIGRPNVKLICTVQLARFAFPDWYSYKQSHCIEQLFALQNRAEQAINLTRHAHDALGDVRMCREVYLACCEKLGIAFDDYQTLHELSEKIRLERIKNRKLISEQYANAPIKVMPFGKYRGQPISKLTEDYTQWVLLNVDNLRPNLKTALEKHLKIKKTYLAKNNEIRNPIIVK